MALADEQASLYHLHLEFDKPSIAEPLAQALDDCLRELNGEYDDKRASGRLRPLKLSRFCDNASEVIKSWCVVFGINIHHAIFLACSCFPSVPKAITL